MATEYPETDRNDRGKGSFGDYRYGLNPNNARVRLRLAGSNPYQDALRELAESGAAPLETAISRRTQQQDAEDAPIEVRLFTGSRVSGPVGWIPRGLESVVDETAQLLAAGWTLVGAQRDPSDGKGYGMFSYVQPPSGLIVELVDRAVLPHFEQWWAAALA